MHQQKLDLINDANLDKVEHIRQKLIEKDNLMQDTAILLEREKDFRTAIELKRLAVCDFGNETQPWHEKVMKENSALKEQLCQVKEDIRAVLD
jgi:hypothetical protein